MENVVSRKLTAREQRVIEIRDTAFSRVMTRGKWERVRCNKAPNGTLPWVRYEGDGFTISLRTPFDKRHAPIDVLKYQAALREQGQEIPYLTLPWQLDIWPGTGQGTLNKVLNIEWGDGGPLLITSFRRGAWEDEILQWRTTDAPLENAIGGGNGR